MRHILKVFLNKKNSEKITDESKKMLPFSIQERADRFLSEKAKIEFLTGRILLKIGLKKFGLEKEFEKIQYTEAGKPFVNGIHFNISHTDGLVVCAFSDTEIGIDVEKKRPINLNNFKSFFTKKEWNEINENNDSIDCFFKFWVKKESLIKVSGKTLKILNQIDTSLFSKKQFFDGQFFYFKNLDFGENYVGAACSPTPFQKIEVEEVLI